MQGVESSSTVAWADIDSDGDLDIIFGNTGNTGLGFGSGGGQPNLFYIYEHCPGIHARFGPTQSCTTVPLFARRGVNTDQAFECAAHHTGSPVQSQCQACAPGFERPLGANACSKCLVGTAQRNGEMTPCVACEAGTYAQINGMRPPFEQRDG